MSDLREYRHVGSHPNSLEGGRMVEPGEFTGPIDPALPANATLIEDGQLIEGSAPEPDKTDKADKAKRKEGESA